MSQYDYNKSKSGESQDEKRHQGDTKHGKHEHRLNKQQNSVSKDKKNEDRSGRGDWQK